MICDISKVSGSKSIFDTLNRINWNYGRGDIEKVFQDNLGNYYAVIDFKLGHENIKFSFPRPGFIKFRGKIRRIKSH